MANESGKRIIIDTLPAFPELRKIINEESKLFIESVLYAGEEFEIVF